MVNIDDDDTLTPVKKMALQVTYIVKHKSKLESDPDLWEIFFSDSKVMKIDTDHLGNSATFENLYLKLFGRPTPYIKRAEWKVFLRIITADDSKVLEVAAESESEMEYIANQIFEHICTMKIDKDKEIAGTGRVLFDNDKDGCLCLTSQKVEEILQTKGYKITPDKLSTAMVELGFKTPGTAAVRYGGNKRIRSWHFIKAKVEEMQSNAGDGESNISSTENGDKLNVGEAEGLSADIAREAVPAQDGAC